MRRLASHPSKGVFLFAPLPPATSVTNKTRHLPRPQFAYLENPKQEPLCSLVVRIPQCDSFRHPHRATSLGPCSWRGKQQPVLHVPQGHLRAPQTPILLQLTSEKAHGKASLTPTQLSLQLSFCCTNISRRDQTLRRQSPHSVYTPSSKHF